MEIYDFVSIKPKTNQFIKIFPNQINYKNVIFFFLNLSLTNDWSKSYLKYYEEKRRFFPQTVFVALNYQP
jgi:hypothetical protein